ncbi:MAG: rRNA pseudouridine synthase [Clostridia bacterium]|nr:rRNA pseudouridine synthase [Clostridia bacterium]
MQEESRQEAVRLQKYIASAGLASRRKAEELIAQGKVKVNGKTVREQGVKVDAQSDVVEVNGQTIAPEKKKYYLLLNKPAGYITTTSDELGRQTVMELVDDISARVYPVGRLDAETEGLLFLTNDGAFANTLTHPSHGIEKEYLVYARGVMMPAALNKLKRGVALEDFTTKSAEVELIGIDRNISTVKIKIREGKNRQVRRMFEAVGHEVLYLRRTQIGPIMLGNVPLGKWRHLKKAEVQRLMKL